MTRWDLSGKLTSWWVVLATGLAVGALGSALTGSILGYGEFRGSQDENTYPLELLAGEIPGDEPWAQAVPSLDVTHPPSATNCDQLYSMLHEHDGVDFNVSNIVLTIHVRAKALVHIKQIRTMIVEHKQFLPGEIIQCYPAASRTNIPADRVLFVGASINKVSPPAEQAPSGIAGGQLLLPETLLDRLEHGEQELESGEQIQSRIQVFSDEDGYYSWNLAVDLQINGQSRTLVVGDGDRPFRTGARPIYTWCGAQPERGFAVYTSQDNPCPPA